MKRSHALCVALAAIGFTSSAFAGRAHITGSGLDFYIQSAAMPGYAGDPNHWLSGPELRDLHTQLNAGGIVTDGVVTILLADTDAGLTLFALVDSNVNNGDGALDAILGMSSTTVATAGYVMNDLGVDLANYSNDGSTQSLWGDYFWHPDGGADGMGWTGLVHGDTGTFDFSAYLSQPGEGGQSIGESTFAGLASNETFQFINWNGSAWETIMSSSFDEGGSFSFAFAIVPAPPAIALGLAGLGIISMSRKRRSTKA